MKHSFGIRVYYEDTDLAGIVYYANYLKFIERARSEFLREIGVDQVALKETSGIVFAVRRVEADYISPAKFDDELRVETVVSAIKGASLTLDQSVWRGDNLLFSAIVVIAALASNGKPARLPADVRHVLGASTSSG